MSPRHSNTRVSDQKTENDSKKICKEKNMVLTQTLQGILKKICFGCVSAINLQDKPTNIVYWILNQTFSKWFHTCCFEPRYITYQLTQPGVHTKVCFSYKWKPLKINSLGFSCPRIVHNLSIHVKDILAVHCIRGHGSLLLWLLAIPLLLA